MEEKRQKMDRKDKQTKKQWLGYLEGMEDTIIAEKIAWAESGGKKRRGRP